jgi:hypothetical protein
VSGAGASLGLTARVAAAVAPAVEATVQAQTAFSARCSTPRRKAPSEWRRVMLDGFGENIRLGEWGKPGGRWEHPGGMWKARAAGARDTSGRGVYNSMKTTSQHDSLLDVYIHSEGSTRYVAAPIPLVGDRRGMRISLCMRTSEIPGYKIAFLLWPRDGDGNAQGEIDFPENKLLRTNTNAFMHYDPRPRSGKFQDWYDGGVHVLGWHVFTMQWRPSHDYVSFWVDGVRIGRSIKPQVPDGPMHYVMQMETYPRDPLPAPTSGHVLVDWFTIDVPR